MKIQSLILEWGWWDRMASQNLHFQHVLKICYYFILSSKDLEDLENKMEKLNMCNEP